jgi:hypothetical protein
MAFTLPLLLYPNHALEPHIDARTMKIHHDKHHNTYVTNLNNAIEKTDPDNLKPEDVLKKKSNYLMAVRNDGNKAMTKKKDSPKKKPGKPLPNEPDKNIPTKPDKDPDPTEPEPEKSDPTRIDEPEKADPTRIDEPEKNDRY